MESMKRKDKISDIHFGKIRYITQSVDRRDLFRKLVKEKELTTGDLTLILSSIGLNPEHYNYRTPEDRITFYLYQKDPMRELSDHLYE